MGAVYWRLLRKLERQRFQVFSPVPTRLSSLLKILLILRAGSRFLFGVGAPGYGSEAPPGAPDGSSCDEPCPCSSPADRQR